MNIKKKLVKDVSIDDFFTYEMVKNMEEFLRVSLRTFSSSYININIRWDYLETCVYLKLSSTRFRDNLDIFVNKSLLFNKYSESEYSLIWIILKEEIINELYRLRNRYKDVPKGVNKKLWNLSVHLESSSYYDFESSITVNDFNLPVKNKAEVYYEILADRAKNFNEENKDSKDSESNSDDKKTISNSDQNNYYNKDRKESDINKGTEDNITDENNSQSEEISNSSISEENANKEDSKITKHNKSESKKSGECDIFSEERDCEDITDEIISNFIENEKKYLDENKSLIIDYEINKKFPKAARNINGGYIKQVERKSPKNSIFFDKIKDFIIESEEIMTITKTEKKKTYLRYSWKTDDRSSTNIIYQGNKRLLGGVSKVFKNTPVIFFDISGSTSDINKDINDLIYLFWDRGYICNVYNQILLGSIDSSTPYTHFKSIGGTKTLNSIGEYLALRYKDFEDFRDIERISGKIGNFYIVTDGRESYNDLFKTFPNTKVFKISNDARSIMLITKGREKRIF